MHLLALAVVNALNTATYLSNDIVYFVHFVYDGEVVASRGGSLEKTQGRGGARIYDNRR